jgi:hypothetical protein
MKMKKSLPLLCGIFLILLGNIVDATELVGDPGVPPWVSFTELEQLLQNVVLQINNNKGNFSEFHHFQQREIPLAVGKITEQIKTKNLNERQKLIEALNADANYAIDIAIAFVGSKGTINKKTQALLTRWNHANYRIYRALARLFPHINRERLGRMLQSRIGELYYLAKAIGSYDENNKEKHVNDVMMHAGISLEYAYEIDRTIEREIMRTIPPQCSSENAFPEL